MSTVSVSFQGTENLKRIFKDFPEGGYRKPLNAAFVKASVPVKSAMINGLPSSISSVSKVIKAKSSRKGKGEPSLAVGVFSSGGKIFRNSKGINWNPWVIANWLNYGTLDWRAERFHAFKTPVRRKTRSDRMVGIKPRLFIERAWEASKGQAQKIFEEEADKEIMKFLNAQASK
jgi:hypothetical protein